MATEAARAAGAIIMERYERLERIVHKSEKDVVTEVDHLSEAAIIELIRSAFPGDPLLAEESGVSGPQAQRLWVIDPLDGTVNYANGIPYFAVSIGLVLDGEPVMGVVLDPTRGELFHAISGSGAFLDGRPIHNPGKALISDAVVHWACPARALPARAHATGRRCASRARWAARRWA